MLGDRQSFPRVARGLSFLAISVILAACGGGGYGGGGSSRDTTAPTATNSQSGATLSGNTAIVIHFSESMNPASLQLGGTLATDSNGGVWSRTAADNDTFTLSPRGAAWTVGATDTLSINAKDLAGNALATLTASYFVPPTFATFQAADVVIGQQDFAASDTQPAAPNTLSNPYGTPGITTDGKLFVGDFRNNRVLAFNRLPVANGASADFILSGRSGPEQVIATGNKLVVVDFSGNQVLIYGSIPTDASATPSVVVGSSSSLSTCDATSLFTPESAAVTPNGKLIVTDSRHNRVLIWNALPTADGQPADLVLGQADATHCEINDDNQDGVRDATPSARTFSYPAGVWSDGQRLVVLDNANNRALIWNSFPTSNFQPANLVLGQSGFTGAAGNDDNQDGAFDGPPTARTLNGPYEGVDSNGVQLAITDNSNSRVLIWNSFPTTNFQPADAVLGQADFVHGTSNDDNQDQVRDASASARTLNFPGGVLFAADKLLVSDTLNNRVLIFKSR